MAKAIALMWYFVNSYLRTTTLACLVLFAVRASADTPPPDPRLAFDHANQLYERGEYAKAADAYQKILSSGTVSLPLYFNLGNAFFKSGQIGRAIISYRLAQNLDPRDPDVRANLRFARSQVNGPAADSAPWHRWTHWLTLNEITVLFTVAFWTWMLLLTLRVIRKQPFAAIAIRTSGWASAVLGAWFLVTLFVHQEQQIAVVIAPEAVVRYGPLEESKSSFTLPNGSEVALIGTKDDWLRIEDRRGRTGWVRSSQIAPASPESLLPDTRTEILGTSSALLPLTVARFTPGAVRPDPSMERLMPLTLK